MSTSEDILAAFNRQDAKFRRACQQIRLLNRRIDDAQVRYDRGYSANQRSYRYTLRLQLATLEGTRNMFYEYACRRQLMAAGLELSTDTEEASTEH